MEESPKVPADHDQSGLRTDGSVPSLAQDEPMAIGDETASAVCDGYQLVQEAWFGIST